MPLKPALRLGRAWLFLCFALAAHVADEAFTGFLSVYNPTVISFRDELPWLPLPVFRFDVWLGGLILAVVLLSLLSVFVFRGARWIRPIAYALAVLMIFNALSHTLATMLGHTHPSVRLDGPMPGFYSSPLLLAASVWLLVELRRTAGSPSAIP